MYRINQLVLPVGFKKSELNKYVARKIKADESMLKAVKLLKLSIDARVKSDIRYISNVAFDIDGYFDHHKLRGVEKYEEKQVSLPKYNGKKDKIVVVGSGPAGLFASLVLAEAGACVMLIERGYEMSKRKVAVDSMMLDGVLDEVSNIQFGEGGAGTFSDGKLNTGIASEYVRYVLETFHKYGADENILYEAKPHVGTDVLSSVIVNIREYLKSIGVDVMFETKLVDVKVEGDKLVSVAVEKNSQLHNIECDKVVLAIGHSSRDTIRMLYNKNIAFKQKPFSLGYRIEHLQQDINISQYGRDNCARSDGDVVGLPPAEYKLVEHVGERVVYTFCMCPGGVVVPATSVNGCVVTNGMSYNARDGKNANSALLVSVGVEDFPSNHPLAGIELQEQWEQFAYSKTGSYKAIVQRVGDFLRGVPTTALGKVIPTYKPGYVLGSVEDMLPPYVVSSIKDALPRLGNKIKCFADNDAILTGVETRSSAPYQIVRDDNMQTSIQGVYAIGEGAGMAGGIVSSAVDGIKCAVAIIKQNA
ncbi:MAG: FAD-binding protein [Clostridiales bacterium]|nr:FAD-binding protein [Clostridiales bacterium]